MVWTPISAGDGRPSHHTFATDTGVFSLAGLASGNLSLHLEDLDNQYALYICTGVWNITDAANGKADFTPSATDLLASNPFGRGGNFRSYPVVTLPTGPVAMDAQTLQILYRP